VQLRMKELWYAHEDNTKDLVRHEILELIIRY